jgi:hypothetical protein
MEEMATLYTERACQTVVVASQQEKWCCGESRNVNRTLRGKEV